VRFDIRASTCAVCSNLSLVR